MTAHAHVSPDQAATQETLARLSCETLVAVLRSDNLRVPSELHVFQAVIAWLEADPARLGLAAEVRAPLHAWRDSPASCVRCMALNSAISLSGWGLTLQSESLALKMRACMRTRTHLIAFHASSADWVVV